MACLREGACTRTVGAGIEATPGPGAPTARVDKLKVLSAVGMRFLLNSRHNSSSRAGTSSRWCSIIANRVERGEGADAVFVPEAVARRLAANHRAVASSVRHVASSRVGCGACGSAQTEHRINGRTQADAADLPVRSCAGGFEQAVSTCASMRIRRSEPKTGRKSGVRAPAASLMPAVELSHRAIGNRPPTKSISAPLCPVSPARPTGSCAACGRRPTV
jgi:hypothetical protein